MAALQPLYLVIAIFTELQTETSTFAMNAFLFTDSTPHFPSVHQSNSECGIGEHPSEIGDIDCVSCPPMPQGCKTYELSPRTYDYCMKCDFDNSSSMDTWKIGLIIAIVVLFLVGLSGVIFYKVRKKVLTCRKNLERSGDSKASENEEGTEITGLNLNPNDEFQEKCKQFKVQVMYAI